MLTSVFFVEFKFWGENACLGNACLGREVGKRRQLAAMRPAA